MCCSAGPRGCWCCWRCPGCEPLITWVEDRIFILLRLWLRPRPAALRGPLPAGALRPRGSRQRVAARGEESPVRETGRRRAGGRRAIPDAGRAPGSAHDPLGAHPGHPGRQPAAAARGPRAARHHAAPAPSPAAAAPPTRAASTAAGPVRTASPRTRRPPAPHGARGLRRRRGAQPFQQRCHRAVLDLEVQPARAVLHGDDRARAAASGPWSSRALGPARSAPGCVEADVRFDVVLGFCGRFGIGAMTATVGGRAAREGPAAHAPVTVPSAGHTCVTGQDTRFAGTSVTRTRHVMRATG